MDGAGNRITADEFVTEAVAPLQLQSVASTQSQSVATTPDTIGVAHGSSENTALPLTYALRNSNDAGPADIITEAGSSDYLPIVGDWDGNGTDTIGYYRPGDGRFFLFNKLNPGPLDVATSFSISLTVLAGDIPVVGDWDGDGKDSVGLYRAATGVFYLQNTTQDNGTIDQTVLLAGVPGEIPVVGDWNGDGVDTPGLYTPASATFTLSDSFENNHTDYTVAVGIYGGKPFAGDWDGDGKSGIGLLLDPHDGNPNSTVYLWNSVTTSESPSVQFEYGMLNEYPLAGVWGTPSASVATPIPSEAAPTFLPQDVTPAPEWGQPTNTPTVASTATSEPQATATPTAEIPSGGESIVAPNSVPDLSKVTRHIDYTYDGLNRLFSANYRDTRIDNSEVSYGYGIRYFLSGNRSIVSDRDNEWFYNYNKQNQLTSRSNGNAAWVTNTYHYDANGNMTSAVSYADNVAYDTMTLVYDAENRLTSVTSGMKGETTYAYDAIGERIKQTNHAGQSPMTTTNYLLDLSGGLSQVLAEDTNGDFGDDIGTWYLPGIGQQQDGQWSYFTQDGLGSTRQLLTSSGDVAYSAVYDPYGNVIDSQSTDASTYSSKLGFTGEQSDANGLIYLRVRYYSPEMGMFLSRDPVKGVSDRFMSHNGYSYAEANPVNYTDPSGQCALCDVFKIIQTATLILLRQAKDDLDWINPRAGAIADWTFKWAGWYELADSAYNILHFDEPPSDRLSKFLRDRFSGQYKYDSGYQQVRDDLEPWGGLVTLATILNSVRSIPTMINGLGSAFSLIKGGSQAARLVGNGTLALQQAWSISVNVGQLAAAARGAIGVASGVAALNSFGSNVLRMSDNTDSSSWQRPSGVRPTRKLGDLQPLHEPGMNPVAEEALRSLTDEELLQTVLNPQNGDLVKVRPSGNTIVDGNTRIIEMLRRMRNNPEGIFNSNLEIPVIEEAKRGFGWNLPDDY